MRTAAMNVDYVDHMGTDLSVVNAARVSFDKESKWNYGAAELKPDPYDPEATIWGCPRTLKESDAKLINYLAKHNHWSPFAHTSIQLRVKAPIFVARQLVKHQVGGVWNEVSRRYVNSEPEFWFPDQWRGRPEGSMKQGSSGVMPESAMWDSAAKEHVKSCLAWYESAIASGMAPEQARVILPQNMMSEWYWTGSLMFFTRVCKQRLDPHAQQETREIAERIAKIVAPLFPVSWSALMESENA